MMIYFALMLNTSTLFMVSLLGLITFLYAIPLIPKNYIVDKQQNLRQIGGIKVYVIALVWMAATVLVPLINEEKIINLDIIITALQRFLFVIVLMIPFEIRDLNYDSLKLATLPQTTGIKGAKIIGILILMLFFILEYFKDEVTALSVLSTLIITFITLLFLIISKKNNHKYYTSFWVESLPIIWLTVLLLFS
ncbi:hypothetical protein [Winogradskyella sp.]|uniref:hypothetical protein n=1 Tax=Winogradskyella sp. TaxID=1883156 RepID=UPI0037048004